MPSSPSTLAHHAPPGQQQPSTQTPPQAVPGAAQSHMGDQHQQGIANLLQLSGGSNPIYDVLYAGSSNQAFPSGNVWSWPFGFNGERGL
jgi:hypothetical protein